MRHGKKFNHLGRTASHRKAMLSNMANSLITHKRINTTLAKGKALQRYIEPLITKSKTDTTHSRRVVFSYLKSKEAVTELFREVATKVADRPGGYTRIIKMGFRQGDNAEMCMIELVDYNDVYSNEKPKKAKRSRRGGSTKTAAPKAEAPKVEEAPKAEEAPEAKAADTTEAKAPEAPKAEEAPKEETKKEDKKKDADKGE